jgi:hypothetical protein
MIHKINWDTTHINWDYNTYHAIYYMQWNNVTYFFLCFFNYFSRILNYSSYFLRAPSYYLSYSSSFSSVYLMWVCNFLMQTCRSLLRRLLSLAWRNSSICHKYVNFDSAASIIISLQDNFLVLFHSWNW